MSDVPGMDECVDMAGGVYIVFLLLVVHLVDDVVGVYATKALELLFLLGVLKIVD